MIITGVCAATLLGAVPALAHQSDAEASSRLTRATAAYKANDCKTALDVLGKNQGGLDVASGQQAQAYDLLVACELSLGDPERALATARSATKLPRTSNYVWLARFTLEVGLKQYKAGVATLETMEQSAPSALNTVPLLSLNEFSGLLAANGDEDLLLRLLRVGTDPHYQPDNPFVPADVLRLKMVELLVKRNQTAAAADVIAHIEDPGGRVRLALEFRSKALQPTPVPTRELAEARLARYQALAQQHPEWLKSSYYVSFRLRQVGRPTEALRVLTKVRPFINDRGRFADYDEWVNYWWNELAEVYLMLGDLSNALNALGKGAALPENGHGNISQAINLMLLQAELGRPAEALASADEFIRSGVKLSRYGSIQLHVARGCAAAKLGDKATARAELSIVRGLKPDVESLDDLLVCVDDLDAVAAEFIKRLSDPESRLDALMLLASYDPAPAGALETPLITALPKIRSRPDVMAAITKAGGAPTISYQLIDY